MSDVLDAATLPADIAAALRALFGGATIEALEEMGGGLSRATLLSFTVGGTAYVLRQGDLAHAPRTLACLRIAAERGVAPRLHYADARSGVAIMDRVDGAPLGLSASPDPQRLERVAATLRRLHDGPPFPPGLSVAEAVAAMETQLRARARGGLPAEIAATLEGLVTCLAPFAGAAPCHNDLNPNNVLEADGRIYFVDWETASAGDPFVDLAQLGVFAFPRPEQRDALLEAYLGRRPTAHETARATVARVVALAVYAAAFFQVASFSGAPRTPGTSVSLAELRATLAVSRERADPGVLASALLREMRDETASEAFAEAKPRLAEA